MPQQNLLFYFRSVDDAKKAEQALHQAGFTEVQVDEISPYPGEGVQERMNPLTGNIPGIADLTLAADIGSKSAGILTSTDVNASGMSDGFNMAQGNEEQAGRNVLVTVVTTDKRGDEARNILKKYGGI